MRLTLRMSLLKATQLGFSFTPRKDTERKEVQRPGSRGGHGYVDEHGKWQYGDRPTPEHATAPAPTPPAAPTAATPELPASIHERLDKLMGTLPKDPRLLSQMREKVTGMLAHADGKEMAFWQAALARLDAHAVPAPAPTPPAPTTAAAQPYTPGEQIQINGGTMVDSRFREHAFGWEKVKVRSVDPDGALHYENDDGVSGVIMRPHAGNVQRGWDTTPPPRPTPAARPTPEAAPTPARPTEAKTYATDPKAQPYEVLEGEYVERQLGLMKSRADRNVAAWREAAAKEKPGSKRHRDAEYQAEWWAKDAEKFAAGDPQRIEIARRNSALTYLKLVKAAISTGKPVPLAVIGQSIEYRKAADARARYDKGRHTSFGNVSSAVDNSMQKTRGYKVKRQDGKAIPAKQRDEIATGMDELEAVLGPLKDICEHANLTIAHTSGKHPFLSSSGGQYAPGERTITMGVASRFGRGSIPSLAHEFGHFLDFEAGRMQGVSERVGGGYYSRGKAFVTSSLAEKDHRGRGGADSEATSLLRNAAYKMNGEREAYRLQKSKLNAAATDEARADIERFQVTMGPYWHEPCEIWARLVEQHVGTKLGKGGVSMDSPGFYARHPGYWTPEVFAEMQPLVERELQRRLSIIRGAALTKAETEPGWWRRMLLKAAAAVGIHAPGSHGGHGYYDRKGHWQYGDPPAILTRAGKPFPDPLLHKLQAKSTERSRALRPHLERYAATGRPVEFAGDRPDRVMVLSKNPRVPGGHRITHFGPDGPLRHTEHDSLEGAAADLVHEEHASGELAPGKVDHWAQQPAWAEGMRQAKYMQAYNGEIYAHGDHDRAHAAASAAMLKAVPTSLGELLKAEQLGFAFKPREDVHRPGSRGGHGYYDEHAHWQYGERPTAAPVMVGPASYHHVDPTRPPATEGSAEVKITHDPATGYSWRGLWSRKRGGPFPTREAALADFRKPVAVPPPAPPPPMRHELTPLEDIRERIDNLTDNNENPKRIEAYEQMRDAIASGKSMLELGLDNPLPFRMPVGTRVDWYEPAHGVTGTLEIVSAEPTFRYVHVKPVGAIQPGSYLEQRFHPSQTFNDGAISMATVDFKHFRFAPPAAAPAAAPAKPNAWHALHAVARHALGLTPEVTSAPATTADPKRAAKLRLAADAMQATIDYDKDPGIAHQNVTRRRAGIAGNMFERAQQAEKVQGVLRNLADQVEAGSADPLLAKVATRTDVEMLLSKYTEYSAPWVHEGQLRWLSDYLALPDLKKRAEMPARELATLQKTIGRLHARGQAQHATNERGAYRVDLTPDDAEAVTTAVRLIQKVRPKNQYGHVQTLQYDHALDAIAKWKRAHRLGIGSAEQFQGAKTALRSLVGPQQVDPQAAIRKLERELLGQKIPGYFPTPKALATSAVELAEIGPGMRVLEPSAGKGDLADAITAAGGDVLAVEHSPSLAAVAKAKGHETRVTDFLSLSPADVGTFDRVVMNPPFERGQEIDHVRHAYGFLRPGGRLVAIMSEGPFFRSTAHDVAFREWLDAHGATSERNDPGAFRRHETSDRTTGVSTRIVTLEKPAGAAALLKAVRKKRPELVARKAAIEKDLFYLDEEDLPALDGQDDNASVLHKAQLVSMRAELMGELLAIDEHLLKAARLETAAVAQERRARKELRKAHRLHYRRTVDGMGMSIENRAGSFRHWHDHDGTSGKTKMPAPYGYVPCAFARRAYGGEARFIGQIDALPWATWKQDVRATGQQGADLVHGVVVAREGGGLLKAKLVLHAKTPPARDLGAALERLRPALAHVVEQLASLFSDVPVAARIKDTGGPPESAGVPEDLASARCTFATAEDQQLALGRIRRAFQVTKEQDFVTRPKDGAHYRGVHLVVTVDGLPIEIQLRTKRQTQFATYVHDVLARIGSAQLPPELVPYLCALSDAYAAEDAGDEAEIPECPPEIARKYGCPEDLEDSDAEAA